MGKYGREIRIKSIEEYNKSSLYSKKDHYGNTIKRKGVNPVLVVNNKPLQGRPIKVLKWFIDIGFKRNWFSPKTFEEMVIFGFDRNYLKSDIPLFFKTTWRGFEEMFDREAKKRRLKELE